jgi:hypothetical protein
MILICCKEVGREHCWRLGWENGHGHWAVFGDTMTIICFLACEFKYL